MSVRQVKTRIIPTRVGTSRRSPRPSLLRRDHPHACGDKFCQQHESGVAKGSSPRVWGQVKNNLAIEPLSRIIPTRMGTSSICYQRVQIHRDHPHAYGDKTPVLAQSGVMTGSSPRVWGQVGVAWRGEAWSGIIPTRMGTRFINFTHRPQIKDHPHAYGDKLP